METVMTRVQIFLTAIVFVLMYVALGRQDMWWTTILICLAASLAARGIERLVRPGTQRESSQPAEAAPADLPGTTSVDAVAECATGKETE
jgi:hypothetical protein